MLKKVKRKIYLCYMLFIFYSMISISGCKEKSPPPVPKLVSTDKTLDGLKWLANVLYKDYDIPESNYVDLAISKWQNGVLDADPFLLYNYMHHFNDNPDADLSLHIYDEEKDIIGIIVEEEHIDSNGIKTILKEEYPVFLHFAQGDILYTRDITVYVRDSNQTKDVEQWREYATKSREQLRSEFLSSGQHRIVGDFNGTLPKVWISIPKSDKIINLYVYDKNGNISKPVELHYKNTRTRVGI